MKKLTELLEWQDAFNFVIAVFITLFIYFLIRGAILNSRMGNDQKRRTLSNIRAIFFIIVLFSFVVIWATELYQFTLSIAALGAALAIASKEVILNFGGTFYRAFARPFSVGDRIEIKEIRGDVVEVGLMSTQLLEVGPKNYTHQYTGRMISIPNSLFLGEMIKNESDTNFHDENAFVLHTFLVPITNTKNWKKHYSLLLESAKKSCNRYTTDANRYFTKIAKKRQVDVPWIEPRINVRFESPTEINLLVRITIPINLKGVLEQEIIKNYLNSIHTQEE